MITGVFSLGAEYISVGFAGDYEPQHRFHLPDNIYSDRTAMQDMLLQSIRSLLVQAEALTVIIVEPPLFCLDYKQLIAEILLRDFHVHGVGFLQRSVCCVVGTRNMNGIMIDSAEQLAVPVYDCRELSPMICGLGEYTQDKVIEVILKKVAIDLRSELRDNVVEYSDELTWLGASALTARQNVWPITTREKLRRDGRVWDSLYDMK